VKLIAAWEWMQGTPDFIFNPTSFSDFKCLTDTHRDTQTPTAFSPVWVEPLEGQAPNPP
jgi:hypothetical protein